MQAKTCIKPHVGDEQALGHITPLNQLSRLILPGTYRLLFSFVCFKVRFVLFLRQGICGLRWSGRPEAENDLEFLVPLPPLPK